MLLLSRDSFGAKRNGSAVPVQSLWSRGSANDDGPVEIAGLTLAAKAVTTIPIMMAKRTTISISIICS